MALKNKIRIPDAIKSGFVYLVSMVLTKGLSIITTPIFTRVMPTSEIGIVSIYNSWYSILSGVVTLGLTSGGLTLCLNEYGNNKDKYISSVLSLSSISALGFTLTYILFPSLYRNILGLPDYLIVLMFVCFLFCPAYDYWITKQRFDYKYKLSGSVMIGSSILSAAFSLIAVLAVKQDEVYSYATAKLFGNYIVALTVAVVIWISIFVRGRTFYNKTYWKTSLALSLPLIGQMLASQVLGVSDRIMIEKYCSIEEVGIYSTVYTIGTLTTMLWTAVNGTFTPYIYKNIKDNPTDVKRNSFVVLSLFSIISVMVVLLGPEITRILCSEEYLEGIYIIPPVAAGVYLISISDLYSDLLIYIQKTKYIMICTMISATLNIIFNAIYIPRYGYIAAAYTTLFSYVTMTVLLVLFTRVCYKKAEINLSGIYAQKKVFILTIITIGIDLICVLTYYNLVLRFLIIALFILLAVIIIMKTKLIIKLKDILIPQEC